MEQSFKKGYSQVPDFRKEKVRTEIMNVLSLEKDHQWCRRLRGDCNLNNAERQAIENVFTSLNIIDIWGSENYKMPS